MSNVIPINSGGRGGGDKVASGAGNRPLESARSLLRIAIGSIGDDGVIGWPAEFSDIGEVVRLAGERIAGWLGTVSALLDAGLDPRNGKTISPIRGVLSLGLDRLEAFLGGEPGDGGEAKELADSA